MTAYLFTGNYGNYSCLVIAESDDRAWELLAEKEESSKEELSDSGWHIEVELPTNVEGIG